jgi:hypothetical protein
MPMPASRLRNAYSKKIIRYGFLLTVALIRRRGFKYLAQNVLGKRRHPKLSAKSSADLEICAVILIHLEN